MSVSSSRLLLLCIIGLSLLGPGCKKKTEPAEKETAEEPAQTAETPAQSADSEKDEKDEASDPKVIDEPFFYRVEGPDGASGHLLGTMHLGIDAEKELPEFVWDVVKSAKVLAIEADVTDPALIKGLMLPEGTNLRKELGEETWALLEEALGEMQAKALMRMKPAAAASQLAAKGLPFTMPMDLLLLNMATAAKNEIEFLESAVFQLELLDEVMNAEFLHQMLTAPDSNDAAKMLEIYRTGDEAAMLEMMLDPAAWGKKAEENIQKMIYQRNANWIPKIEELLAGKDVVIAVGAAHLIGEHSVSDLLRKKGYSITRVTK